MDSLESRSAAALRSSGRLLDRGHIGFLRYNRKSTSGVSNISHTTLAAFGLAIQNCFQAEITWRSRSSLNAQVPSSKHFLEGLYVTVLEIIRLCHSFARNKADAEGLRKFGVEEAQPLTVVNGALIGSLEVGLASACCIACIIGCINGVVQYINRQGYNRDVTPI